MNTLTVAGSGPAAIHLLAEAARSTFDCNITVIDQRSMPFGGSPHSDPSPSLRVNMRTELHDIPGQPSFRSFLREHGGSMYNPPLRWDLGRYTAFVCENSIATLRRQGCCIRQITATANSIERRCGGGYLINLSSGPAISSDYVVLATGHEPPQLPSGLEPACGPQTSLYTGDSGFALDIKRTDRVVVLGTGPGGIDAARFLIDDARLKQPVHMCSPSGMFSAVQTDELPSPELEMKAAALIDRLEQQPPSLELLARQGVQFFRIYDGSFPSDNTKSAIEQLHVDIAAAATGGPIWRLALEAMGAQAPRVWRWLGPSEQARLTRMKEPNWLSWYYHKRHAMQPATASYLSTQLAEGRITIGTLRTVPHYDHLVVATGPNYRVSQSHNPLIIQSLAVGLARPYIAPDGHELGGFVTSRLQLVDAPGVFAMGGLVRGEDFAVHGYPSLARHARVILDQIA